MSQAPRIRVLQEDWGVFQNVAAQAARFTEQTGVEVEVTLSLIPEMWELMEQSFLGVDPPFDLVGVDDLMLVAAARAGGVEPLDARIEADGYTLCDFAAAAVEAVSDGGRVWGLPYCAVSNVLIYRADLFERWSIAVPQTLDELASAAVLAQEAGRHDFGDDFCGIAIRGAPSCGLNFWTVGSTWAPSFGARWFGADGRLTIDTPELRSAVEHYVDLLRNAGPPRSETMGFLECMQWYGAGRAAMTMEPANEASLLYDGAYGSDPAVVDGTRTALVPAGPLGTRHPGLYAPPYAIPARSRMKDEAWELAKFLCAPEQMVGDAVSAGFVEVARDAVLDEPEFVERFRSELLDTARATRPFARGERPLTRFGLAVGDIVGEQVAHALQGEVAVSDALRIAQTRVDALGAP